MDEIDEKTWVLEPEKPTRSATARRIALGRGKERLNELGFWYLIILLLLRKMTLKMTVGS